jgi:hypothetical protein
MIKPRGGISLWRFEGNANDAWGGHHGTVTGATLEAGFSGQAYSFNGTTDKISLGANSAFSFGSTPFTFGCRFRFASGSAGNILFSKYDASGDRREMLIREIGGEMRLTTSSNGAAGGILTFDSAGAGLIHSTWYHVALARSGASATWYIDGVAQASAGSVPATIYAGTAEALIGNLFTTFFTGLLDEAWFVARALSAGNIRRCMLGMHPI